MQVVGRGLLGLAALSAVASCQLDTSGLSNRDAGVVGSSGTGGGTTTGAAGTSATGAAGSIALMGTAGDGGGAGTGAAGDVGAAGTGAAGTSATGAAGDSPTGAAGDVGAAGTGAAGTGAAGTGAAGTGAAGTGAVSRIGCADGTREGFQSQTKYPTIAACSGAWTIPGLIANDTLVPRCQRRAGNDGANTSGQGCSVADLCAEGWHVCESV